MEFGQYERVDDSSDGEDSLNVMPDGNMGYLQHMNPPQRKTWSLSVGAVLSSNTKYNSSYSDTMIPPTTDNLTWKTNCPPSPDEDDEGYSSEEKCWVTRRSNLTQAQKFMLSHSSYYVKTPDHIDEPTTMQRCRAYAPLNDDCLTEPRSPPSSEAVTPGFPEPTPMTRSYALCHNETRFDTQDQSPENSSSPIVKKLDFGPWRET